MATGSNYWSSPDVIQPGNMEFRPFDLKRDQQAAHRIWRETGWIDHGDKDDEKYLDAFLSDGRALVADINGQAESLVVSVSGSIRHLQSEIAMSAVSAVTTSHIARRQGFASRLTAQLIAEDAKAGLDVAALGMFEQGYYTRLGFGTGPYQHFLHLDPADLQINTKARVPVRLSVDDYQDVHQALVKRWKSHGGINLDSPQHVRAEMGWTEKPFGLGFRNATGELTHFLWGKALDEAGPYVINAMAYRNREQLLELFALLVGLSDQVVSVHLREPSHLQLQDLLKTPFRRLNSFRGSDSRLAASHRSNAYWQLRINNLVSCLANTKLPGRKTLSFNLTLTDPIVDFLQADQLWRGTGGEYSVHLGEECEAKPGHSAGLQEITAGVAGFSRLWLGAASATALSVVGDIQGPETLIRQLDQTLSLPLPKMDWDF